MKIAGLMTLGYEPFVSLGILFFGCSASLSGTTLRILALGYAVQARLATSPPANSTKIAPNFVLSIH
ncbi:hypothetical protein Spb1_21680 [Planctopirus ephydatiae]|uniref:Uncharacterized protein n=1 Tax=Planctopirus ephydatiae TaxID=2528019 RepID=A0A518GNN3_9PLAN|nr:hypothetical protein Spb1_21680 [Planctopirus ephydatiae]